MTRYDEFNRRTARLRERYRSILSQDAEALSSALLSELDSILRDNPTVDFDQLAAIIEREFIMPAGAQRTIESHLKEGQAAIAKMRLQQFSTVTDAALSLDPVVLRARTAIDFPAIHSALNRTVQRTLRHILDRGGEIDDVRRALETSRIAAHQAQTLANTALAQYDSASVFTLAKQAGISTFKFIGPPAERPFCQRLLQSDREYTLAEINNMDNGQGLPVWSSRGGYNCRHEWIAIPVDLDKPEPPQTV